MTDQLIDHLTRNVKPVRAGAIRRRLGIGVAAGMLGSFVIVALTIGMRPDLAQAVRGFPFWMKWGYTISLAAIALAATGQLARPEPRDLRWLWVTTIPVAVLAAIGATELARTPQADWLAMWLGHSWRRCPWLILALAGPIFVGLLWSFRRLAPTRLRATGAAAGLAAGASAATVYGMHCPEVSALFMLTWYSLGLLLATLVGAMLGPRLLRW